MGSDDRRIIKLSDVGARDSYHEIRQAMAELAEASRRDALGDDANGRRRREALDIAQEEAYRRRMAVSHAYEKAAEAGAYRDLAAGEPEESAKRQAYLRLADLIDRETPEERIDLIQKENQDRAVEAEARRKADEEHFKKEHHVFAKVVTLAIE